MQDGLQSDFVDHLSLRPSLLGEILSAPTDKTASSWLVVPSSLAARDLGV